jgi:hypothetical protein
LGPQSFSSSQELPKQSGISAPFSHTHFLLRQSCPGKQSLFFVQSVVLQSGILAFGFLQTQLFLTHACAPVHFSHGGSDLHSGSWSSGFLHVHSPFLQSCGVGQSFASEQGCPLHSG